MKDRIISVFGGSGFLGGYIVRDLLAAGAHVKVFSNNPDQALPLKINAPLGQLETHYINISDQDAIKNAITGSDTIINLIGTRTESARHLFMVHVVFPKLLAKCAKQLHISRLIHFSTIGVEKSYESNYAHSKYEGDQCVHNEHHNSVIVRPGLVFGQNDHFIYRLYFLMMKLPFFLTANRNKTIRPIHASDVSHAVLNILAHYKKYQGRIVNLVGTKDYSLDTILSIIEKNLRKKISVVSLPTYAYRMYVSLSRLLPEPIMDKEQLHLLRYNYNNNTSKNYLKRMQIQDRDLEEFMLSDLGEKE